MTRRHEYRTRLYENYLTLGGAPRLDEMYYRNWARVARGHFRGLLPEDRQAEILDVGCGHGTLLYTLKSMGYGNIHGVDCSEDQVREARRIHAGVDRADALDHLESRRERFDTIIAIDLLEHFTREEGLEFLESCRKALRPGGRLLLQLPNADCLRGVQTVSGDIGHEAGYTPRSLAQMLSMAGFDDVVIRPAGPVPHGFTSTIRWALWKIIVLATLVYDLVETGTPGSRIHTRVLVAAGQRTKHGSTVHQQEGSVCVS